MGTVIAVGGPPHSGKSVLLGELYSRLLARKPHDLFLQPACNDGEGKWSHESSPNVAARLRRKGKPNEEWVDFALASIRGARRTKRLLLVDLGGKLADDNRQVLELCDYIIVLSSAEDQIEPWCEFAAKSNCPTLAILRSSLAKGEDGNLDMTARSNIRLDQEPIVGSLINLDREAPTDCYAEAVDTLANHLTERFLNPIP